MILEHILVLNALHNLLYRFSDHPENKLCGSKTRHQPLRNTKEQYLSCNAHEKSSKLVWQFPLSNLRKQHLLELFLFQEFPSYHHQLYTCKHQQQFQRDGEETKMVVSYSPDTKKRTMQAQLFYFSIIWCKQKKSQTYSESHTREI